MKPYRDFFKRTIDVVASGGALLVLSIPLAAVTTWLYFTNKGAGVFFPLKVDHSIHYLSFIQLSHV